MLRDYRGLALLIAIAGQSLWGPARSDPAPPLQAQDIFSLSRASDPRFRPDGAVIAYVRTTNDVMTDQGRMSIWLVDARTGAQTPLGAGEADASSPRWSPAGDRLAYVSTARGGAPGSMCAGCRTGAQGGSPACSGRRNSWPGRPTAVRWPSS